MSNFLCPHCSTFLPIHESIYRKYSVSFEISQLIFPAHSRISTAQQDSKIELEFFKCPNCGEYIILARGIGDSVKNVFTPFFPQSLAKRFPDYVPEAIRTDYKEAYAIVNLSPKASATLSRRCLQTMIRDFWGISKNRLVDEIVALADGDKVPAAQRKILHGLREIGNIGAHPETDVNTIIDIEPADAEKLLKVIELLIKQWYVERHEEEQLYNSVIGIKEAADNKRTAK